MTQTYELSFKPFSSAAVHLLPNFTLAMLLPAQLVNISNNIKVDNIFMIKIYSMKLCFAWHKLDQKKKYELY